MTEPWEESAKRTAKLGAFKDSHEGFLSGDIGLMGADGHVLHRRADGPMPGGHLDFGEVLIFLDHVGNHAVLQAMRMPFSGRQSGGFGIPLKQTEELHAADCSALGREEQVAGMIVLPGLEPFPERSDFIE